jgi:hypothetical protein
MDKFVPKPNTGSMFKVSVKTTEGSPDMRGDILIDTRGLDIGEDGMALVKISGWKSTSKTSGKSYLSLKVDQWKPKDKPFAKPQPKREELDDDIPF